MVLILVSSINFTTQSHFMGKIQLKISHLENFSLAYYISLNLSIKTNQTVGNLYRFTEVKSHSFKSQKLIFFG